MTLSSSLGAERTPIPQGDRFNMCDDGPNYWKLFGRKPWRIFTTDHPDEPGRVGTYHETLQGAPMFYFEGADCVLVTQGYYAPV